MKRTGLLLTCILFLTACVNDNIEEILIARDDISITWKGELQLAYDTKDCQLGYNYENNVFRIYDDKLSNWFIMDCDEMPSFVDQKVTADVTWTTSNDEESRSDLSFTVKKIDTDGLVWMWNDSERIGIIIKTL